MSIKPDSWIKKMSIEKSMIAPFEPGLVRDGVISYGVSSYGYDFRLGYDFKEPITDGSSYIDPKNGSNTSYRRLTSKEPFDISPQSIVIAQSLEYFKIPRNILAICFGKSTYTRSGLMVNITPLEPEWEGILTFPLINNTPHIIRVYPGEGIAQLLFLESNVICETSYADRKGKYQCQQGITLAKV